MLATQRPSFHHVPATFRVLEFAPTLARTMWTYTTCGMSWPDMPQLLELHLFSPRQSPELVDLLTAVAHYHQTAHALGVDHAVNFGVPWLPDSACSCGLVSLPYLDGPALERMPYQAQQVQCLWLIPIAPAERDFKVAYGVEALEELFEQTGFDYVNPTRPSVV
ncbi:suppressor of fused domain protein [Hymenobacter frigidus]|nr:suppressor of fused domain protein [Hymenobacter frigidus]